MADDFELRADEAIEARLPVSRCKSCGRKIVWARNTKTGKMIPLDAETIVFDVWMGPKDAEGRPTAECSRNMAENDSCAILVSHFATCPNAAAHSRSSS